MGTSRSVRIPFEEDLADHYKELVRALAEEHGARASRVFSHRREITALLTFPDPGEADEDMDAFAERFEGAAGQLLEEARRVLDRAYLHRVREALASEEMATEIEEARKVTTGGILATGHQAFGIITNLVRIYDRFTGGLS